MQVLYYFISAVFDCSLLLCPVVIIYWLLKKGNVKQKLRLVLLASTRVLLLAGTLSLLNLFVEAFSACYSGVEYEQYAFINRITGPYWWAYWVMMTGGVIIPQFLWFRKIRNSVVAAFVIPITANFGKLVERLIIIITAQHRDYLVSSWSMYHPFYVSWGQLAVYAIAVAIIYAVMKWWRIRKVNLQAN